MAAGLCLAIHVSCGKEETAPVTGTSGQILFSVPVMSVETRSEFRNVLEEGDEFGVMGYCVPYSNTSSTDFAYGSADALWSTKRAFCSPDVFYCQRVRVGSQGCTYDGFSDTGTENNPKYWYRDGFGLDNSPNSQVQEADDYRYSFFAYYPYDSFDIITPSARDEIGAPVLEFTMPQTGSDLNDVLEHSLTPDAMLGVLYDQRSETGRLGFSLSHVLTGIGFVVNNLSDNRELKVYSIKLRGTFYKKVRVDFSEDIVDFSFPPDRYTGTYTLYDWGESPLELPFSSGGTYFQDHVSELQHILLISGEGSFFGEDVEVVIEYDFGNGRIIDSFSRPGTFTPSPGVRYTAQLNFVGDAFVLQFAVDNSEIWEDGELDDGDDSNDDIVFE